MPKVVTQRCLEQDLNLRPVDRKAKCLTRCTIAPPWQVKLCNPSLTRAVPERLRDEQLIIKLCTNKASFTFTSITDDCRVRMLSLWAGSSGADEVAM